MVVVSGSTVSFTRRLMVFVDGGERLTNGLSSPEGMASAAVGVGEVLITGIV